MGSLRAWAGRRAGARWGLRGVVVFRAGAEFLLGALVIRRGGAKGCGRRLARGRAGAGLARNAELPRRLAPTPLHGRGICSRKGLGW
jgi:hypothetical protein